MGYLLDDTTLFLFCMIAVETGNRSNGGERGLSVFAVHAVFNYSFIITRATVQSVISFVHQKYTNEFIVT
jgi:hypothetical protein